jgi:hypothetical protein
MREEELGQLIAIWSRTVPDWFIARSMDSSANLIFKLGGTSAANRSKQGRSPDEHGGDPSVRGAAQEHLGSRERCD